MKTGIIFDVDGTLWDACDVIADSWNEYIRLHAPGIPENATYSLVRSLCGQTMDRFAAAVFPKLEKTAGLKLMEECGVYEVEYLQTHSGNVYPGLEEVLQTLTEEGYPLYIVSNCQSGYVEAFLQRTGFGKYFLDIEYYGRTGRPKDENIKKLSERNHLVRPVYLGDTQGDCDAAEKAGAVFLHAAYGFGTLNCERPFISSLYELPAAVKSMTGEKHVDS